MNVGLAWMVHFFTASGVLFALLALQAIDRQSWTAALLWLFAALVVDGVDGWLARTLRVRERLPRISGDALDLVVDYLTYVFVPVVFMLEAGLLTGVEAWPLAAAILISSLYVFARSDMKTEDNYFRGFPALWNVVAFYLYALQLPGWAASTVVAGLIVATFAPLTVVHPLRTGDFRIAAAAAAVVWTASTAMLLLPELPHAVEQVSRGASFSSLALLCALSLWRSFQRNEVRPPISLD